jgi:hypothetical protein
MYTQRPLLSRKFARQDILLVLDGAPKVFLWFSGTTGQPQHATHGGFISAAAISAMVACVPFSSISRQRNARVKARVISAYRSSSAMPCAAQTDARAANLSCQSPGKAQKIALLRESSGESRIKVGRRF